MQPPEHLVIKFRLNPRSRLPETLLHQHMRRETLRPRPTPVTLRHLLIMPLSQVLPDVPADPPTHRVRIRIAQVEPPAATLSPRRFQPTTRPIVSGNRLRQPDPQRVHMNRPGLRMIFTSP